MTDNRASAISAKVDLREKALAFVGDAHVLDAFCGRGMMHERVWHKASSYVGIDQRLYWPPAVPRFCGETTRILRAVDLSPYNVFDLDSWGSPWHAALIIATRRSWYPDERGALVLTSGAAGKTRFGSIARDIKQLLGRRTMMTAPTVKEAQGIHRLCVRRWLELAMVKLMGSWQAVSPAGNKGSLLMIYTAIAFCGRSLEGSQDGRLS